MTFNLKPRNVCCDIVVCPSSFMLRVTQQVINEGMKPVHLLRGCAEEEL